jgi:hypothetical protein
VTKELFISVAFFPKALNPDESRLKEPVNLAWAHSIELLASAPQNSKVIRETERPF